MNPWLRVLWAIGAILIACRNTYIMAATMLGWHDHALCGREGHR